jgi:hypothetical protein
MLGKMSFRKREIEQATLLPYWVALDTITATIDAISGRENEFSFQNQCDRRNLQWASGWLANLNAVGIFPRGKRLDEAPR